MPMTDLGSLRFEVHPPLPAKVNIDAATGVISGCPFMETRLRSQHTIVVKWAKSGEVVAQCPMAFAVASSDLAALCNAAYLDQQPPAFRAQTSQMPNIPQTGRHTTEPTPQILNIPQTGRRTTEPCIGGSASGESDVQVASEDFAVPGIPPKYILPQRGLLSSPFASRQSPSFRARLRSEGTPKELLGEGRLRSSVMALGPPLRDRPQSSASVLRSDFLATSRPSSHMAMRSPRARPTRLEGFDRCGT